LRVVEFLQSRPEGRVLVVTAEVLSPLLDPNDFDTAILFGDASSATVLYGEGHIDRSIARLLRPEVSARGDDGTALSVPLLHDGYIQMRGRKVFSEAVRAMVASLTRVCQRESLGVGDLRGERPPRCGSYLEFLIRQVSAVGTFAGICVSNRNTRNKRVVPCFFVTFQGVTWVVV